MSTKYTKQFVMDAGERIAWTFAQAGLATVSVEAFNFPLWVVVPIATGLAALKAWVAKHVGDGDTASTVGISPGEA